MNKTGLLLALGTLWVASNVSAEPITIVTHETEKYFYKNGQMEKFDGQFENTYLLDLEKDTLIRTRVYDYQTKKIYPGETLYRIQKNLQSYPPNSPRFNVPPVVKAYGEPNENTAEMIMIEDHFVQTATSTSGDMVVSRAKILG